jgi:hypothetical protein
MFKLVRNLDGVDIKLLKDKKNRIEKVFKTWLLVCICLDIGLFVFLITTLVLYSETGYYLSLIPKFLHLFRLVLLIITSTLRMNIYYLRGTSPNKIKLIKQFMHYRPLGLWLLIGIIDLFLFRIPILFIDIIVLAIAGNFVTDQTLVYTILNICFIAEFYLTHYIIWNVGVIRNIVNKLRLR